MKLKKLTGLLAILLAVTMAACGGGAASGDSAASPETPSGEASESSAPATTAGGTLKIGICLPMTGEQAKVGLEMRDAANMVFESIGHKVGDYTLEFVNVDITTDPEKGSLALEQAILKDGIDIAFLNWSSSVGVALMDVVAKYQIPYYFPIATTGTIDDKWNSDPEYYSYYIAKGWPRSEYMSTVYATVIDDAVKNGVWEPRNTNIAIFGEDTDMGRGVGMTLSDTFPDIGWTVVMEDYFTLGATDMYPMLSKIKSTDASLAAGCLSSPPSAAAFLKQAQETNINALIICEALGDIGNFYELTGDSSNLVIDSRPKFSTEEGFAFSAAFEEKYGYTPSAAAGGQIYDYSNFLVKCMEGCIEKYGVLDSESMYKYAQEVLLVGGITYEGGVVHPRYRYIQEGGWLPGPVVGPDDYIFPVVQYYDGEAKTFYPESMKEVDLVIPDYAK